MNFIVSTAFAIDGIAANELRSLGINNVQCKNNHVYFDGTIADAAKACIWLRSADRVGLLLSSFNAYTFDELFDNVSSIYWSDFLTRNSKIIVNARCVHSKLMSERDVQRISKKAIINYLSKKYKTASFLENGETVSINVSIYNDVASVILDLCGDGLHKRSYRTLNAEAPLRETLAASLLLISKYHADNVFLDPFCGSGTLPIEAAMIAANIAPGRNRAFLAENYSWAKNEFSFAKKETYCCETNNNYEILCGDIDPNMVEITKFHAKNAGVKIKVMCRDACKWDDIYHYQGLMVTNPPYGERLSNKNDVQALLKDFSYITSRLLEQYWTLGIITPETDIEKLLCEKSISKRKLFNSNILCTYYQFKNST